MWILVSDTNHFETSQRSVTNVCIDPIIGMSDSSVDVKAKRKWLDERVTQVILGKSSPQIAIDYLIFWSSVLKQPPWNIRIDVLLARESNQDVFICALYLGADGQLMCVLVVQMYTYLVHLQWWKQFSQNYINIHCPCFLVYMQNETKEKSSFQLYRWICCWMNDSSPSS